METHMTRSRLEEIIREEIYKVIAEINLLHEETEETLDEKSVPEPYNRKERRRMTPAQIKKRDSIGKSMKANEKSVKYFKKKFGEDWEYYLWATASNRALQS